MLDAAPFSIFYKDKENRFVRVNKTLEEITGLPKEYLIGKTAFELFPYEADAYWQDDLEVINTGQPKLHVI